MKLLNIIRSLNPTGGGPIEGVCQITPHLSALGVRTSVASLAPPDAPWLQKINLLRPSAWGPCLAAMDITAACPAASRP